MKKSVIFIRSNPVNPDSRVEKEVNTLLKNNFDVKILAWDRSNKYTIKESFLSLENGEAKIFRFGIPAEFGAGIKSLLPFLIFQLKIVYWLLKNRKSYDIIHACDFDTAFTASYLAKFLNKKLIFDIFDFLFTEFRGEKSVFGKIIRKLQYNIINKADGTIICSDKRREQIKGSTPKNLVVIHNSPPSVQEDLKKIKLNKEKIKIVYVGILQDTRFLKELADVIKELNDIELHIGGFGKYEKYFMEMSDKISNVFFYGKLSYDKTLELENSCDIMVAIYDPKIGNHYFAAPNKFYEALMLGKPIIMAKNTGMSDVIINNKIGEVIEYNKTSLRQGIEKLISQKLIWPKISIRMKKLYEESYSWSEMEKQLIKFYESI